MLAELALIMGEAFGKLFDQEFATCAWVFDPNFDDSKREILQSEFYNNRSSIIEMICQTANYTANEQDSSADSSAF